MTLSSRTWFLIGAAVIASTAALVVYINIPTESPVTEPEQTPEAPVADNLPLLQESVIGTSVEGRPITVTTFEAPNTPQTTARRHVLFVGGIHGGYEWNSSLLAYNVIDHITANPDFVPTGVSISIIPDLNPDGTARVTKKDGRFTADDISDPTTRVAAGRFNANDVDLNRNFACKWQPESTWRGNIVSAGSAVFSEPEARALRDFVLTTKPDAVILWHSQAGNVYGSECEAGILPGTLTLMNTYAKAANYGAVPSFDAYPVTGDAEGWLASIGIPAVTVELETFNSIEWTRNLAGTHAILNSFIEE